MARPPLRLASLAPCHPLELQFAACPLSQFRSASRFPAHVLTVPAWVALPSLPRAADAGAASFAIRSSACARALSGLVRFPACVARRHLYAPVALQARRRLSSTASTEPAGGDAATQAPRASAATVAGGDGRGPAEEDRPLAHDHGPTSHSHPPTADSFDNGVDMLKRLVREPRPDRDGFHAACTRVHAQVRSYGLPECLRLCDVYASSRLLDGAGVIALTERLLQLLTAPALVVEVPPPLQEQASAQLSGQTTTRTATSFAAPSVATADTRPPAQPQTAPANSLPLATARRILAACARHRVAPEELLHLIAQRCHAVTAPDEEQRGTSTWYDDVLHPSSTTGFLSNSRASSTSSSPESDRKSSKWSPSPSLYSSSSFCDGNLVGSFQDSLVGTLYSLAQLSPGVSTWSSPSSSSPSSSSSSSFSLGACFGRLLKALGSPQALTVRQQVSVGLSMFLLECEDDYSPFLVELLESLARKLDQVPKAKWTAANQSLHAVKNMILQLRLSVKYLAPILYEQLSAECRAALQNMQLLETHGDLTPTQRSRTQMLDKLSWHLSKMRIGHHVHANL
eukprot:GHVT01037374.1.p1 GENE.GHVT01037374.1~~GHVT01037374.1.p1  ORF type:complete len:570 (+),score=114.80 GHVT01037374.1:267-1976(+)